MICYIRRSSIDYDVRLAKYVQCCKRMNIDWIAITWDRLNSSIREQNEHQYKRNAPYGGGWRNIMAIIGWIWFMYGNLFRHWKKYRIIHACNIETCIFVLPLRLFGKKIVLDVYDSMNIPLERYISKVVDLLILPNEKRLEQIGIQEHDVKNFLEIENVPQFDAIDFGHNQPHVEGSNIKLSYVGVFERDIRGIENVLEAVKRDEHVELDIAGVGAGLEPMIEAYAKACSRIRYHGKVTYDEALKIMHDSDLIVALYYQLNPLHKYASPNKYYESLFLQRPIITSLNTLVGSQVAMGGTGYIIDDTPEALYSLLKRTTEKERIEMMKQCGEIWKLHYADYSTNQFDNKYVEIIKSL